MSRTCFALGDVFDADWCADLIRVVAFDQSVVMYDVWWPQRNNWGTARLLGTCSYYRLTRQYFEAHAMYVRSEPLSELEAIVHRPDLPFSFAQRASLSWYDDWPVALDGEREDRGLNAPVIYLMPFGPRDSAKLSVQVVASNGHFFTEHELLRAARAIQQPHLRDARLTDGVGLHRSGFQKRIPSYYIWGAKSRLEAETPNATEKNR